MSFWVTEKFRPHDAGVIELGLEYTDKNSIPPQNEGFTMTGVCNRECTSVGLPPEGITVFASQLHTHLTGIRVITRHFRRREDIYYREKHLHSESTKVEDLEGYIELPTFNWDNHYSTHFQEIRLLKRPIKLLPVRIRKSKCYSIRHAHG
jgi:dopamine beta-monooxygenase